MGQLGGPRALPVLQKLDTRERQDKPWDGDILQYTVDKSPKKINSAFPLTRWMYGRLD